MWSLPRSDRCRDLIIVAIWLLLVTPAKWPCCKRSKLSGEGLCPSARAPQFTQPYTLPTLNLDTLRLRDFIHTHHSPLLGSDPRASALFLLAWSDSAWQKYARHLQSFPLQKRSSPAKAARLSHGSYLHSSPPELGTQVRPSLHKRSSPAEAAACHLQLALILPPTPARNLGQTLVRQRTLFASQASCRSPGACAHSFALSDPKPSRFSPRACTHSSPLSPELRANPPGNTLTTKLSSPHIIASANHWPRFVK